MSTDKNPHALYERVVAMPRMPEYVVPGHDNAAVLRHIEDYAEVIAVLDKYGAAFVRNLAVCWREEQEALDWQHRAPIRWPDGVESPLWKKDAEGFLVPR